MKHFKRTVLYLALAVLFCTLFSACVKLDDREAKLRDLIWPVGAPLPTAESFVEELPDGWEVRFADIAWQDQLRDFRAYTLDLILTDGYGNEHRESVRLELVLDNEPPVLLGVKDLSVYVGDGISYRSGVSATDNCFGEIKLEIDTSAVNNQAAGVYPVIYTATDAAGNCTTVEIKVYVYDEVISEEMLYAEIDRVLAEIVSPADSTEEAVRAVYRYVYYGIAYDDFSDKSDWVRAAYEGLRTGRGDCFTYFALSKAFFERLEIENMKIQRTEGIVDERHYWNLVNIGTEESPRWYHFDACRISGATHSGCLLTDAQIAAYTATRVDENGVGNYFYAYDKSAYPATEEHIITPGLAPLG